MKIALVCLPTAFSETNSRAAIAALERPSAISVSTSRSRSVSRSRAAGPVAQPGDQAGDHLGVEHGAAGGDPAYGGHELVDVGDPVLEQVADRALAAGQQVAGVERSTCWLSTSTGSPGRAARAAIAAASPSVENVGGRRTSTIAMSKSPLGEQPAPAVARCRPPPTTTMSLASRIRVSPTRSSAWSSARTALSCAVRGLVGHGTSMVTTVGPPAGLSTTIVPSNAASRFATPARPEPCRVRAAPPVVADDEVQHLAVVPDPHPGAGRVGVLDRVGQALGDREVRRRLDRRRQRRRVHGHRDRQRDRQRERLEAAGQPAVGQGRRVDAAHHRAQVLQCAHRRLPGLAQQRRGGLGVGAHQLLGQPDVHADRGDPGLGAVVQVALDPAHLRGAVVQGLGA